MNIPLVNITAIVLGLVFILMGTVLMIVAAFRESILWGLGVIFVPFANLVFTCMHWAKAKSGFIATILGSALLTGGMVTVPGLQEQFVKAAMEKGAWKKDTAAKGPDLSAEIADHRQRLETLQATFALDGADLTKQYQALDTQRKALKPGDTEAITKFNEAAAAYQARNTARKQMQQQIASTQQELDGLLDKRSRENAAANAAGTTGNKKVVMYTTNHCPACRAAKDYFAKKGVRYEEIDVESSQTGLQEFKKLGGNGVPLILVGDKKMEGFSPQALDALL
jgi:glutaredoxin